MLATHKNLKKDFFTLDQSDALTKDSLLKVVLFFVKQKLAHLYPEEHQELLKLKFPIQGCQLTFALDEHARTSAYLFDKGTQIPEEKVKKQLAKIKNDESPMQQEDKKPEKEKTTVDNAHIIDILEQDTPPKEKTKVDDAEAGVQLGNYILLLTIRKGANILGKTASLDLSGLLKYKKKGGDLLLPWKAVLPLMKESSKSGVVAMFGNIFSEATDLAGSIRTKPFSISDESQNGKKWMNLWVNFGLSLIANQIATPTSAAVVPREMEQTRQYIYAALLVKYSDGFFLPPTVDELSAAIPAKTIWHKLRLTSDKQYSEDTKLGFYIEQNIEMAMDVSKATGTAINSMGVGSFISFAGYSTVYHLAHKFHWSDIAQKVATITFNTPTELISMAFISASSNIMGSEWSKKWLSTDNNKNKQILEKIIGHAFTYPTEVSTDRTAITVHEKYLMPLAELKRIYQPYLVLSFAYGKGVINTMNFITPKIWSAKQVVTEDVIKKVWHKLQAASKQPSEPKEAKETMNEDETPQLVEKDEQMKLEFSQEIV
uniref:Nucleoprotein n=1 Tax=Ditylenchus dipsaci TaxID=166011 RepID=A0A915DSV3_9BILA